MNTPNLMDGGLKSVGYAQSNWWFMFRIKNGEIISIGYSIKKPNGKFEKVKQHLLKS